MVAGSDDRLLWLVVASGLLIAANTIPFYLQQVRAINTVTDKISPSRGPCEEAEDSLKLCTLEKLAAGPNYKLRSSAVKIIAERSTREVPRQLLLQQLASKIPAQREQALHAIWFLLSYSGLKGSSELTQTLTTDPSAFPALVSCLANILPLHQNGPLVRADNPTASSPLLPYNRPPSETPALRILSKFLSDQTVPAALSAGLVSRWLKHYPFPCALPENGAQRQQVVPLFNTWGGDDPPMASIVKLLIRHPEGLKELYRHGLMGPSYGEAVTDPGGVVEDVSMRDGEDTAGLPPHPSSTTGPTSEPASGPRPSSTRSSRRRLPDPTSNDAERAVRQRRREAAVYSEGDSPLTQDSIFQRQSSSSNVGLEQEQVGRLPLGARHHGMESEAVRMDEGRERGEVELVRALVEIRVGDAEEMEQYERRVGLGLEPRGVWRWLPRRPAWTGAF